MDARHPVLTRLLMILAGAYIATAVTACGGGYGGSSYGGGGGNNCGGAYMGACPPPTVSITAPASGAAVMGTVAITASAAPAAGYNNLSITSVQFMLDGAALGAAVTNAPYTINWDTTKAANGSHSLTARATDNMNDSMTSAAVMVTVSGGIAAAAMSATQMFPMTSSKASGVARISVASDTGAVSGTVRLSGMTAQAVTINQGFAGSTGDAVVTLAPRAGSAGEFVVPANVTLSAEQAAAFAQGRLYVLATSAANPNGEIRGQLAPESVRVTFSELGASPEAASLGLRASGVAATTVDTRTGTLTVHVSTAGLEEAASARVLSGAAGLADLARSPVEMGHFSTELARISAADVESFEAGRLSVSVAASAIPAGALHGAISAQAATARE